MPDRLLGAVVRLAHMLILALVAPILGERQRVSNSFSRLSAAGGLRPAGGEGAKRSGIVAKAGDPGPVKTAPLRFRAWPHGPSSGSFHRGARWEPWPPFRPRPA